MDNKKGELSITVIILVVLGLVILAVMIYLIIQNTNGYNNSTACARAGGHCMQEGVDGKLCGDPIISPPNMCGARTCCRIGS